MIEEVSMSNGPIEGIVKNGQICLLEHEALPEDTRVFVYVQEAPMDVVHIRSPRLVNPADAERLRKRIVEVSPDARL
jgi:hypothetical protein